MLTLLSSTGFDAVTCSLRPVSSFFPSHSRFYRTTGRSFTGRRLSDLRGLSTGRPPRVNGRRFRTSHQCPGSNRTLHQWWPSCERCCPAPARWRPDLRLAAAARQSLGGLRNPGRAPEDLDRRALRQEYLAGLLGQDRSLLQGERDPVT